MIIKTNKLIDQHIRIDALVESSIDKYQFAFHMVKSTVVAILKAIEEALESK